MTKGLQKRTLSPLSKLRETRGMVSLKTVPDNFEVRNKQAKTEYPKFGFKYV